MNYWQIGSGDSTRDYSDVFFDFGVAIVGPGNNGHYLENNDKYDEASSKKIEPLFSMKMGDRIVLRKGRQRILAVGEIKTGDYGYSNLFSDIDGWDLQHYIEVEWRKLDHNFLKNILSMSTLQRLEASEVIQFIEECWGILEKIPTKFKLDKVEVIDTKDGRITNEELESFLIEQGLRISDAENMTKTIKRVEKLGIWFLNERGENSSEHEVRTFLVIPFLLSLGWSEQRIGIEVSCERKRIDIILFQDTKRKIPIVLLETKKIWTGLRNAYDQIEFYAKNLTTVKYLMTTDGLRYSFYEKINENWEETAYLNFRKMLDRHTCYKRIKGVKYIVGKLLEAK